MAIDWFSGLVGYDASRLRLGQLARVTADGELVWLKEAWEKAEGSFSSSVQVSRDAATASMRESGFLCSPVVLRVSGNPTKFLQGHNVFGPSVSDLGPVVQGMVRGLPEELRPVDADSGELPAVHRSRVDVQVMVDLGHHDVVHDWLRLAEVSSRSRHGRAMASGSTVYWGKHSTRWSLKAYCKYCELVDHRPTVLPGGAGEASLLLDRAGGFRAGQRSMGDGERDLASLLEIPPESMFEELRAACKGHLRIELVLRRPELKDREGLSDDIVWDFYEKVVIGVQRELVDIETGVSALKLPWPVKSVLMNWLDGRDVTHDLPRATFYKYRRQVLDELGVDISLARDDQLPKLERVGFESAYLRSREVKAAPEGLQRTLFKV